MLWLSDLETQVPRVLPLMEITHIRQKDKILAVEASRAEALGRRVCSDVGATSLRMSGSHK